MSTSLESYEEALTAARDFAASGNKKDRARVALAVAQIGGLVELMDEASPGSPVNIESMRRVGVLCRALAGHRER